MLTRVGLYPVELIEGSHAPVMREMSAGFKLASEATFLANPGDDHSAKIFDKSISGKTDRFVLRFEKAR